jgi:small subunit ribosomal protein S8
MENSIIDLIIRIKNGYMAKNDQISSPYSIFKEEILKKLVELRYIKGYTVDGDLKKTCNIELSYKNSVPTMTDVKPYSTPGQRQYVSYKDLKPVQSGFGHSIISTSKGIMTNKEARDAKIGGELLFKIW